MRFEMNKNANGYSSLIIEVMQSADMALLARE